MQNEIITQFGKRNIRGHMASVPLHPDPILAADGLSASFLERFFGKVSKIGSCWPWTGAKKESGVGIIERSSRSNRGKSGSIRASRASRLIHNGEIPDGMKILSACPRHDNSCVNPNHLYCGPHSDMKLARDRNTDVPVTSVQLNRASELCAQAGIAQSDIAAEWMIKHPIPEWMLEQGFSETFLDRFWPRIQKTEHCWIWTGHTNPDGYGLIGKGRNQDGNLISAHRASWIFHHRTIPNGLHVLHNCKPNKDNPACVNPAHLWLGTNKQNARDALKKCADRGHGFWTQNKLTVADVLEIRRLHKDGTQLRDIANKFSVTKGHVSHIVNGRTWRVPEAGWIPAPDDDYSI